MKLLKKHFLYWLASIIIALSIFLGIELILRAIYYQRHGQYPVALVHTIVSLKEHHARAKAEQEVKNIIQQQRGVGSADIDFIDVDPTQIGGKLHEVLYTEQGLTILKKFQTLYEQEFLKFVQATQNIQSKLMVLYIPSSEKKDAIRTDICRSFFQKLTRQYHVDYLDMTDLWFTYPVEWVSLRPENPHPSRLGNQLVAQEIAKYLDLYKAYRSGYTFQTRPAIFGDLPPSLNDVWQIVPMMPYHVISNHQGFRMNYELTFPKQQQRILVLGDSYTFGAYLHNQDCYPNLLDKKYTDREIINGGIAGYTIPDETSLFVERACYVEPDITILQVLDNDIFEFFYFLRNEFARDKRKYEPSQEELDFIVHVKTSLHTPKP